MKKYDLLIDGIPMSVYSVDKPTEHREGIRRELRDGELAILLYPTWDTDFGIVCFDKNNREPREPGLSLAALFYFFGTVCHFPKMTLEMKYHDKIYELHIGEKTPEITVNIKKCKIQCTKTVEFVDGVELWVHTVTQDYNILCAVCHDCEFFDGERLSSLLSSPILTQAAAAVAISVSDKIRIKSVGNPHFPDAIAAGALALISEGSILPEGLSIVELDGREHKISYSRGILTFYPSIKYLY